MTILQALVLGIVQGISEFFPVSSSGHLILVPYIFGWELQDLSFDVALHLGTALAVLIFFWRDWYEMIVSLFMDVHEAIISRKFTLSTLRRETKLLIMILLVSIPVAVAGLFLEDIIESTFRSSLFVGWMLIIVAFVMLAADRYAKSHAKDMETDVFKIPFKKALLISLSQILALFPGTSRSGISISTALFNKIEYKQAAKFSFLLATPLIIGAGLIKVPDILNSSIDMVPVLVGFFASFITGVLTIRVLLDVLKKYGLIIFVIYRIALGIIILVL